MSLIPVVGTTADVRIYRLSSRHHVVKIADVPRYFYEGRSFLLVSVDIEKDEILNMLINLNARVTFLDLKVQEAFNDYKEGYLTCTQLGL